MQTNLRSVLEFPNLAQSLLSHPLLLSLLAKQLSDSHGNGICKKASKALKHSGRDKSIRGIISFQWYSGSGDDGERRQEIFTLTEEVDIKMTWTID